MDIQNFEPCVLRGYEILVKGDEPTQLDNVAPFQLSFYEALAHRASEMVATGDFDAPLSPDESEIPSNIRVSVETLMALGIDPRVFRPIVKSSQTGEVVDGLHRLQADPTWPTMEADFTPLQEKALRLILNWNRRQYTPEEMRQSLSAIVEGTGWTGNQIAQNLAIPKATVYRYLPSKYKNEKYDSTKNHAPATMVSNETISVLSTEAPLATAAHDRYGGIRLPSRLKESFDELDRKRAMTEEAPTLEHEGLTHEELPEENAKTPDETLNEIYKEFPRTPPTRFLQTALRRGHPDLSEEQINEIIEETRPEPLVPRHQISFGVSCPVCDTWKPASSMKRIVRELEKKDPELATFVRDRLQQQGLMV